MIGGIAACGRGGQPVPAGVSSGALRGDNVLLVTIDTLRADHVGAYGSALGLTPTLDRLAKEGLRFDTAHAHVPMTLPSHTTIMTGLYPVANGVHDNGSFRFDGAKPTLAGTLKRAGYRTGAFVGAFVLDARFGLNAGFDVYDDRVQGASANLEIVQRTAEQVLAPAYEWITNGPSPQSLVCLGPPVRSARTVHTAGAISPRATARIRIRAKSPTRTRRSAAFSIVCAAETPSIAPSS